MSRMVQPLSHTSITTTLRQAPSNDEKILDRDVATNPSMPHIEPGVQAGESTALSLEEPSADTHPPSVRSEKQMEVAGSHHSAETLKDSHVQSTEKDSSNVTPDQSACTSATVSCNTSALDDDVANGLVRRTIGGHDPEHDFEKSEIIIENDHKPLWNPSESPEPPSEKAKVTDKQSLPLSRRIRHKLFNAYERLFSLVFIANMVALVVTLVHRRHSKPFGPSLSNVATATAANVTGAILMRQEYVINALYTVCCWTPHWAPLRFRRTIAKVYHFGGIHSGAAVSATVWYTLYTILLTKQYADGNFQSNPVMALTYLLVLLLIFICVFAYPSFRSKSHNTFENIHRLGGWSAVGLFWAQVIFLAIVQSKQSGATLLGSTLVKTPPFWFLILITLSIILPWLRLRKVQCWTEVLSPKALRLHFNYSVVGVVVGIRIANHPLKEWHPFATIPEKDGSSFHLVVTGVGSEDSWTHKQIANPQYSYWVRGIPLIGVLRMAVVFKRVVIVTTGSGIGPCMSLLVNHTMPCRILWAAPNPLEVYGQPTLDAVAAADPEACIINTKGVPRSQRPNMTEMAHRLYKESDSEAVFVISNIELTYKVVFELESRGVPAYGPIWDS